MAIRLIHTSVAPATGLNVAFQDRVACFFPMYQRRESTRLIERFLARKRQPVLLIRYQFLDNYFRA